MEAKIRKLDEQFDDMENGTKQSKWVQIYSKII